jgi:hypothetical protein
MADMAEMEIRNDGKNDWTDWENLNEDELKKAIKKVFYNGKSWLDEE